LSARRTTKRNTPPEQDSHAGTASREHPPCPPPAAVTFYLAVPPGSAVCVAWPAASAHPPFAWPPDRSCRSGGPADPHPLHRARAKLGVQPADQLGREQSHLGRPSGRVRGHGQLAVVQGFGPGMRGQLGTDNLRPSPENRPHCGRLAPAVCIKQSVDRRVQRLRVVPAWPAAPRRGRVGGGVTFWPVNLWPGRPVPLGQGISLRPGQGLAGDPRPGRVVRHARSPRRKPRTSGPPGGRVRRQARPR